MPRKKTVHLNFELHFCFVLFISFSAVTLSMCVLEVVFLTKLLIFSLFVCACNLLRIRIKSAQNTGFGQTPDSTFTEYRTFWRLCGCTASRGTLMERVSTFLFILTLYGSRISIQPCGRRERVFGLRNIEMKL